MVVLIPDVLDVLFVLSSSGRGEAAKPIVEEVLSNGTAMKRIN